MCRGAAGSFSVFRQRLAFALLLLALAPQAAPAADILVEFDGVPDHGIVCARVDLTAAARWCGIDRILPAQLRTARCGTDRQVPVQFIAAEDFDPRTRIVGHLVARLPGRGNWQLRLQVDRAAPPAAGEFDGEIVTSSYRITQRAGAMGGLPSRIEFPETGQVLDSFAWYDRCYDSSHGGYAFRNAPQARVTRLGDGPVCTAVRVAGRYATAAGKLPDSQPSATYTWIYFHDLPLIYVAARVRQRRARAWKEVHFLEMHFGAARFGHWAGGEPVARGTFTGSAASHRFTHWGLVHDGRNGIGMLRCGRTLIYDGKKEGYGRYLHARGAQAWTPWDTLQRESSAWLWIGSADDPEAAVRRADAQLPDSASAVVTVARVEQVLSAARADRAPDAPWWRIAAARQLRARGNYAAAIAAASGTLPAGFHALTAGQLGLLVQKDGARLRLLSLYDIATKTMLSAPHSVPLFELTLRHTRSDAEASVSATDGWRQLELTESDSALTLKWSQPADARLRGLRVTARAAADAASSRIQWTIDVRGQGPAWTLWNVAFPQLAAADYGGRATLLLPIGSGVLKPVARNRGLRSRTRYPSGWTSMAWMALYEATGKSGLYVADHDPWGSTKTLIAEIGDSDAGVTLGYSHAVPDMSRGGNRFTSSGHAVWQLLRGDWFDAAMIYRGWVRAHAKWFPKLTSDGRADTPRWMRELCCWAMGGGKPKEFADLNRQLQRFLDLPVGLHWYRWHQIPFDNDYPHYFPTVPGFSDAVADLQRHDVFVMPYINGRLWDTRDQGMKDFEFAKIALPAATKDEHGKPYIETYGSREADGRHVELAVMCPSTEVWQRRVRAIVLRLMNECQVRGVYIDQVAAARPKLCFDPTHGHPLGGGHWWTESYWKLLQAIRARMPADRILTTECNAEPYIHCFDGYLTWHWQNDGQVPAFPAVYGGAIQMFGRAYRGGPSKDLAFRMKAGQQLVFGEQIGWMNPAVVREKDNATFLRQVVRMRYALRRYFYAGEMARPPKLQDGVPKVTADWQWSGPWPVTTSAVMTGAWRIVPARRAVLLFVNVSDRTVDTMVTLDTNDYLPNATRVRWDRHQTRQSKTDQTEMLNAGRVRRALRIAPRTAVSWELSE